MLPFSLTYVVKILLVMLYSKIITISSIINFIIKLKFQMPLISKKHLNLIKEYFIKK